MHSIRGLLGELGTLMAGKSAPPSADVEAGQRLLEDKTHAQRRRKLINWQAVQFVVILLTILVAVLVLSTDIRADVRAL